MIQQLRTEMTNWLRWICRSDGTLQQMTTSQMTLLSTES